MVGGGILDLIVHHGSAHDKNSAAAFLSENVLIANTDSAPKAQAVLRSNVYRNELVSLFAKRLSTKMDAGVSTGVSIAIGSQL